ncbi:MAG: SDR family NAD(P)-dependent oxidoreductase, partial [Rectinema sp.]|nr:SDR family NAD(P)-dependent oxidoreductase [Rectinema sp.]
MNIPFVSEQVRRYWSEYKWSNVWAMFRNSRIPPKDCKESCKGTLAVITGATSGIGYAASRLFASRGADILTINRSVEKSESLKAELEKEFGILCEYLIADLSLLNNMRRVARTLNDMDRPIDVLIHNAGIYLDRRILTVDGMETTFAVNYLSSFVMNYLLADRLKQEGKARIILVGSEAYRFAVWGLRLDDAQFENCLLYTS